MMPWKKTQACYTSIKKEEKLQSGVSGQILIVWATKKLFLNVKSVQFSHKVRVENKVFRIRAYAGIMQSRQGKICGCVFTGKYYAVTYGTCPVETGQI